MPCYTLVAVQVKDKAMAERALKAMNEEAEITKNANGTWSVTPKNQRGTFRDHFLKEYSAEVATAKAKKNGYTVSRVYQDNGEIELTLRQYS